MKKTVIPILVCMLPCLLIAQSLPTQWEARGMGGGGAVYAPSISPHNSAEAYLSCDMSLLSHTLDFGAHWRTIGFDTMLGFRHSKVNFTNHPDTLYIEKLDQYTSKNFPCRSSNGGLTWTPIPASGQGFWGSFGSFRLFANPGNSRQLVASSYTGVYFSNDWGNTFASIHTAAAQGTSFVHLAGVLYTDDSIFVSTDKGLLLSTNNGGTWQAFMPYSGMGINTGSGGEGVVSFGGAVKNGQTRLVATTINDANMNPRTAPRDVQYFKKLYRMDWNVATTWADITASLVNADGTANSYNFAYQVTMNPDNIDTFYLTGQTRSPAISTGSRFGTVFRTTNGGNAFSNVFLKNNNPANTAISTGWVGAANFPTWPHSWYAINTTEGLCIDPNNVKRLMRSDFSLVCTSEDAGATWQQKYVTSGEHAPLSLIDRFDEYESNGLQTTVCHWLHWINNARVLVAYSDLLLNESPDGGYSWGFFYDSLSASKINDVAMVCPTPSGRLYIPEGEVLATNGDWSDYWLGITNAGRVMYSDDARQWHLFKNFGTPVSWVCTDPNNSAVLYACVISPVGGSGGIWKCTGLPNNPAWTTLAAPTRTEQRPAQLFVLNNGDLLAVYAARDNSTTSPPAYNFTASSGVFLSTNGGTSWTDLCAAYPGMQKDVRSLTIDPHDATQNTWLVGVGANGSGSVAGLYRTTNRGATWTNVWSGKTVTSVTKHPSKPAEMYVCTASDGLYYATAANTNSPSLNLVGNYPFRAPQRVFFNPYSESEVWVTSWGNGLRVGTTIPLAVQAERPLYGATHDDCNALFWNCPAQDHAWFTIERAADGQQFEAIGRVPGSGNATAYRFDDCQPPASAYYRYEKTAAGGLREHSPVIFLDRNGIGPVRMYPNPAAEVLNIESGCEPDAVIEILDARGNAVLHSPATQPAARINVSHLPAGLYFLRSTGTPCIPTRKWIKQ